MSDTTITSANSKLYLSANILFPVPVKMEGYASDRAFTVDAIDMAEINMGVDGRMTAGYVFNPTTQTISLQPDSPSNDFFDLLIEAQKSTRDIYYLSASLEVPSTGKSYTFTKGVLQSGKQVADHAKVQQNKEHKIVWERVNVSLI